MNCPRCQKEMMGRTYYNYTYYDCHCLEAVCVQVDYFSEEIVRIGMNYFGKGISVMFFYRGYTGTNEYIEIVQQGQKIVLPMMDIKSFDINKLHTYKTFF
jgi:hypothetical protein